MRLIIVGNGFDRQHGLDTTYKDFRAFIENADIDFLNAFDYMYSHTVSELWSDLETKLGDIESDLYAGDLLELRHLGLSDGDYDAEETVRLHIKKHFTYINQIYRYLREWINTIEGEIDIINPNMRIFTPNVEDVFINFNYTSTLETHYGIDKSSITYIHGSVLHSEELVLGHGNNMLYDEFLKLTNRYRKMEDTLQDPLLNTTRATIYASSAHYVKGTQKDVKLHLQELKYLPLNNVNEVFIIGHSLGDVDLPYFKYVFDRVGESAEWKITFYDVKDNQRFRETLMSIGISEDRIITINSNNLAEQL
jgi:hypothetical protein